MKNDDPLMMRGEFGECGHCGHEWTFLMRATYTFNPDPESGITTTWQLLQCVACLRITLTENFSEDDWGKVLYPSAGLDTEALPKLISKPYREMLRVKLVSPGACAVMAGRTLEAICVHEQAVGKTLANKLQHLASVGRIPQTLSQMANQLRQIRNIGAHMGDIELDEGDVPVILEFLDALLEYLYVAPAKMRAVEARLKQTP